MELSLVYAPVNAANYRDFKAVVHELFHGELGHVFYYIAPAQSSWTIMFMDGTLEHMVTARSHSSSDPFPSTFLTDFPNAVQLEQEMPLTVGGWHET
jgi:hypothetical protein